MKKELYLILNDIRSAYNVGAIFRTADGAGAAKIYLCGYTPIPADGSKEYKTKAEKMIEKTALGAEQSVAWQQFENFEMLLDELRERGVSIVALEKTNDSQDISIFEKKFPMALILGNEVDGVSDAAMKKCDAIVSIPMRGKKESLNVSVAAGIAMYEILK